MSFAAGSLALYAAMKRKYLDISMFALIFMIRSRYFIPLIDWIARLAPALWKFLADFSVVVSFGGLGAAYLSKYRKDSRNLDLTIFVIGAAAILLWVQGLVLLLACFALLVVCIAYLGRLRNPFADFVFVFVLMTLFFFVFLGMSQSFITTRVTPDQNIIISTLQGAFGLPPLLLGLFMVNASGILSHSTTQPGVSPMIPNVNEEGEIGVTFPGYDIFIPLAYAGIAILVLLLAHELAHGVLARAHNIKLKSTGLLTFGIIPIGAFVEPDEGELEGRPSIEKMRVFTAGSFANLMVCLLCIVALYAIFANSLSIDGITVVRVDENSSVKDLIQNGTVIYKINGAEVKGKESLGVILSSIYPGSNVTLLTSAGIIQAVTLPSSDGSGGSRLGVIVANHFGGFLFESLGYIIFFNLNIALVNLLPVAPFDGWRMLKEVMKAFRISELTASRVVKGIVLFSVFLLVLNALPLVNIAMDYLGSLI